MMKDILFDFVKREIVMNGDGAVGDFVVTDNPSVQNGGILLMSRVAVLGSPISGAGVVEQVIGGHPADATAEMNRWKNMVFDDGGTAASWAGTVNPAGNLTLTSIDVSYL